MLTPYHEPRVANVAMHMYHLSVLGVAVATFAGGVPAPIRADTWIDRALWVSLYAVAGGVGIVARLLAWRAGDNARGWRHASVEAHALLLAAVLWAVWAADVALRAPGDSTYRGALLLVALTTLSAAAGATERAYVLQRIQLVARTNAAVADAARRARIGYDIHGGDTDDAGG
jgi:hypothetical protein